jgi:hypothetical protein
MFIASHRGSHKPGRSRWQRACESPLWTGLQIADEHAAHIDGIGRGIAGQAQILPIQLVLHHEGQSMVDKGIVT